MIETPQTGTPGHDGRETVLPVTLPASLLSGRYRIERVIGEGAFGRVYLAYDIRLRSNVAIKELLTSRNTTVHPTFDRYLTRFQREARAARLAQHANIVTVYDLHVDTEGNNYLVMEYVDGMNLRDLLAQVGALPIERAVAIAIDIASALDAVHEHEIVHRDIKPANIVITRRGVAKLTDFGIALVAGDAETTLLGGSHPGTRLYMSPEQAAGHGSLNRRSDLYSLGLVLYEMLAGQPYAPQRQPLHLLRPELSRQLVAIVDGLLQVDPDARYQTAAALMQDLQRLTSAPPPPPVPPPLPVDPQPAGHRGLLVGAVILAAVTLAFVLFLILRPDDPTPLPSTEVPPTIVSPTVVPTSAPPTVAPTIPPTTAPPTVAPPTTVPPTAVPVSSFVPWTDPNGLISVRYPGPWAVNRTANDSHNLVYYDSRDGTFLYINLYDPQQGSVADEVQVIRRNQVNDANNIFTDAVITDTRVAGEPAQLLTFTYAPKSNPAAKGKGAWWIVNHDNKEFGFFAFNIGSHRSELDAIVASTSLTTGWTDPKGLVRLQVPTGWTVTQDKTASHNALELDGPDGAAFYLDIYDPAFGTLDQEIQDILKNHQGSTKFVYKDGAVTDARIGKEPAKTFTFSDTPKANPSAVPTAGRIWEVNHSGTEFQFAALNDTAHRADIDAILASVVFLK
jgi:serine/threonine protein kinase